jgi:integrase
MPKLFLSEPQIHHLLKLASGHPRNFALIHVALDTGFRVSDLVTLKREDVELSDGSIKKFIRKKMQKTGKFIDRPLREDSQATIKNYLRARTDDNPFLFISVSNNHPSNVGHGMDPASVNRVLKRYLGTMVDRDQLKGNGCHVTRRSVAKIISAKSGHVEAATVFLGHKSIASTIAYLDTNELGRQADEIVNGMAW